jgi:WXG100 family type VII secretion target
LTYVNKEGQMGKSVQLNYEELRAIVKSFKNEGEDILQLQIQTRQKVQDIQMEWEGEAGDKFFEEMETELLPALARTARALFLAEYTLFKVIRIVQEADIESEKYFTGDFGRWLSSINRGAAFSEFSTDQGRSDFFGAGSTGQSQPSQDSGLPGTGSGAGSQPHGQQGSSQGANPPGQSTGGGGGSSNIGGGSGGSGDLNSMGGGLGGVNAAGSSGIGGVSSSSPGITPDHIYGNSDTGSGMGDGTNNSGGSLGGGESTADGEGAAAASAAVAGAAVVGGVVNVVKGRKK